MKKAKIKLQITDQRMLQLPEILKENHLIRFRQEFCDAIDLPKQNIRNIKMGTQHFTALHIERACKEYGLDANWIIGRAAAPVFLTVNKTEKLSGKNV